MESRRQDIQGMDNLKYSGGSFISSEPLLGPPKEEYIMWARQTG